MAREQREKAAAFRDLHLANETFIMPNAWNAGSAIMLAAAGFPAVGTTSAGIAFCLGVGDGKGLLSLEQHLEESARIAAAIDLPVSGDLENGYGHAPEAVADCIDRAIAAGLCGAGIEDVTGDPEAGPFYDIGLAVERIAAARASADASGLPFVLTGRSDVLLHRHPGGLDEAIRRCRRFRDAGADCLFAPGMSDRETIARFVGETGGPVNVLMGLSGGLLTAGELAELGVRRISIGGSLTRATFATIRDAAAELAGSGSFTFARSAMPHAAIEALMRKPG